MTTPSNTCWFRLPNDDAASAASRQLAHTLDHIVQEKVQRAVFSAQDIENIRNRRLDLLERTLHCSPQRLEKLRTVCSLFHVDVTLGEITSHRKYIGAGIVAVKKSLYPILRFFLKGFLERQRDFNASVVSLLADLCNEDSQGVKRSASHEQR